MSVKKGIIFPNVTEQEWEMFKAVCKLEDKDIGEVLGEYLVSYMRAKTEEELLENGE